MNGITVVTPDILTKLFNSAMEAAQLPNSGIDAAHPPVIGVNLSSDGKYAFVELRTDEMATAAMGLNKLEVMGRELHIARPSGWVDPETVANMATAQAGPGATAPGQPPGPPQPENTVHPTNILVLANMFPLNVLSDDMEYNEILADINDECGKFGEVVEVLIPKQGEAGPQHLGKAFVVYRDIVSCQTGFQVMNGRHFAGNQITCAYCYTEEYQQIKASISRLV